MKDCITPIDSIPAAEALRDIRVIYTDLDGTLLAPGGRALVDNAGTPSVALASALVDLRLAGIEVVPVTGRNRLQLTELGRLLNFDAFIGEMGAVLAHGQGSRLTFEYETGDWPADALAIGESPYEKIISMGVIDALFAEFPGAIEYHTPWCDHREASHVLRGSVDIAKARKLLAGFELPVAILDNGVIHPPKHTLTALAPDEPIHSYHVLPAGISKAHAVELDIKERGLACEHTLFIGDSYTDLLAGANTGVAVMLHNALADPRVTDAAEKRCAEGKMTIATNGLTVDGWVEFARTLLAAR